MIILLIVISLKITALVVGELMGFILFGLLSVMLWAILLSTVRGRWNLNTGEDKDDKHI